MHHSKVLLKSFPMNGVLSIESKVRKLCITQGFALGVKGLIHVLLGNRTLCKQNLIPIMREGKFNIDSVTFDNHITVDTVHSLTQPDK